MVQFGQGLVQHEHSSGWREDKQPEIPRNLKDLPLSVRQGFADLPKSTQDELVGIDGSGGGKESISKFARVFEDWASEDRHRTQTWTKKEVAKMEEYQRELSTLWALQQFIVKSGIWKRCVEGGCEETTEDVMELMWRNRGKEPKDMGFYRDAEYNDLRIEYKILVEQKEKLKAQLKKINERRKKKQKITRQMKNNESRLSKELRDKYGVFINYMGLEERTGSAKRIQEIEKIFSQSTKNERPRQETLAHLLEYFDADEFGVMFMEAAERAFRTRLALSGRNINAVIDAVGAGVAAWHKNHAEDGALASGKVQTGKEKMERLTAHTRNLMLSLKSMISGARESSESDQLNTERELVVALGLLKRMA